MKEVARQEHLSLTTVYNIRRGKVGRKKIAVINLEKLLNSPLFQRHRDDLAQMLRIILSMRSQYEAREIRVTGNNSVLVSQSSSAVTGPPTMLSPGTEELAGCLLSHCKQQIPEFAIESWRSMIDKKIDNEIINRLSFLVSSRAFDFCPDCLICQDLRQQVKE